MSAQRALIPWEELPPGWGPVDIAEGTLVYRRHERDVELVADRTEADRTHLGLGLNQCWELRMRYAVGEQSACEPIGRVTTRRAALEGLLECMHRIREHVEQPEEPHEFCAALEDVSLAGVVPETDLESEPS
ncbi:hypothetical protein ACYJ1Y_00410 [Natrialbaceae archaeon A-gly3]